MTHTLDAQQVELIGRGHLVAALAHDGVEIAEPLRDHGVDLVGYVEDEWRSVPIQLKCYRTAGFMIDKRYLRFGPRLCMVYAWHVLDPSDVELYAMTFARAVEIGDNMGYTATASWTDRGTYTTTRPSRRLRALLEPQRITPGDGQLRALIEHP
jgi:hypothetical protein